MACEHPSHPGHGLTLTSHQGRFTCDGCKMDGYGDRYRCDVCNFDLHKECMFPAPTLSPEPLSGHTFSFCRVAPRGSTCPDRAYCGGCRSCDVCGTTVEGFEYHCARRDLDVHPLCALLKREVRVNDVVFRLRDKAVGVCLWCEKRRLRGSDERVPGCCYVSECGSHGFHVRCLMEMGMEGGSGAGGGGDVDGGSRALAVRCPELRVEMKKGRRGGSAGRRKVVKIVKVFLQIDLSVLFGDPTTLLATVVVQLLTG